MIGLAKGGKERDERRARGGKGKRLYLEFRFSLFLLLLSSTVTFRSRHPMRSGEGKKASKQETKFLLGRLVPWPDEARKFGTSEIWNLGEGWKYEIGEDKQKSVRSGVANI